jgi:hypothetical protein
MSKAAYHCPRPMCCVQRYIMCPDRCITSVRSSWTLNTSSNLTVSALSSNSIYVIPVIICFLSKNDCFQISFSVQVSVDPKEHFRPLRQIYFLTKNGICKHQMRGGVWPQLMTNFNFIGSNLVYQDYSSTRLNPAKFQLDQDAAFVFDFHFSQKQCCRHNPCFTGTGHIFSFSEQFYF